MSAAEDIRTAGEAVVGTVQTFVNNTADLVESLEAENAELKRETALKKPVKWGMTYGDNSAFSSDLLSRVGFMNASRRFRQGNEADFVKALTQIKSDANAGCEYTVISFKPAKSWDATAKGQDDTFLNSMRTRLEEAAQSFNIKVYVSFAHEPENDANMTDIKRDQWKAMQAHCADIFSGGSLKYGPILMGYHSMPSVATAGGRWLLENCIPDNVDFVFFDYYEKRGRNKKGTTTEDTGRTAWDTVFKVLRDFCEPKGMEHGLAETGISQRGYAALPGWFDNIYHAMLTYGQTVFLYFNTKTNDGQPAPETTWVMDAKREAGFKGTVDRVLDYNQSL